MKLHFIVSFSSTIFYTSKGEKELITDGFMYIGVLVALAAVMGGIENKFSSNRFFRFIPGIVMIYIGAAFFQTIGLFDNEVSSATYASVKDAQLSAMLMIVLLNC